MPHLCERRYERVISTLQKQLAQHSSERPKTLGSLLHNTHIVKPIKGGGGLGGAMAASDLWAKTL